MKIEIHKHPPILHTPYYYYIKQSLLSSNPSTPLLLLLLLLFCLFSFLDPVFKPVLGRSTCLYKVVRTYTIIILYISKKKKEKKDNHFFSCCNKSYISL
jgi:hypothetical protein